MADIRKRKGSKGITYQVRYSSPAEKSGYAYATFDTLKEARLFTENLGGMRHTSGGEKLTVAAAVQKWLDTCEKTGRDGREIVEKTTLVEYERRAAVMKAHPWEKKYLHEIESADIVQFRQWLLGTKSRDLARRTLSSFHSVLIEMRLQGFIKDDPAMGITIRSDGRYEEDDEVRIPTDQEIRALLTAADRMGEGSERMAKVWRRYRPMIYLAVFSGMRPSEYRGLAWTNVGPDRVNVRQRADRLNKIGPVKSRAGRRTIYLPESVASMILAWRPHCPVSKLGLVFPTASGKPMALSNFARRCWEPLMKAANLMEPDPLRADGTLRPCFSPYALRHYYASKLISKGKDLKFIQTCMGHADIQMTLNVYGHLLKDKEEEHQKTAEDLALELIAAE
ncbi:tyrosine-type recombinase/integrase [Sinorhizobium medicae]|nr:tyrosine-type recombinase/integrase [Sinorhizobium medicae]